MSRTKSETYQFIDTQEHLHQFAADNQNLDWLAFDTEFVGEKRFHTRICLIQVATVNGNYLIDPFGVKDLSPLFNFITDERVLKITHAGENDYRLFYRSHGIVPRNLFDTQIAAGFIGYKYPISFQKLVEGELGVFLKKGYAVADWEARPLKKKQLLYALNDILYLYDLWQKINEKLENAGRQAWAKEEVKALESEEYYQRDPNKEALDNNLIKSLRLKEQAFLMRLFKWRSAIAEQKDYSREMVLPNKLLGQIVRSIGAGKEALFQNRRIPPKVAKEHGKVFEDLYNQQVTETERAILKQVGSDNINDPKEEILIEILYLVMKYNCLEQGIAPNLVLSKSTLKKLRKNNDLNKSILGKGWRQTFLGNDFSEWLSNLDNLRVKHEDGKITLQLDK